MAVSGTDSRLSVNNQAGKTLKHRAHAPAHTMRQRATDRSISPEKEGRSSFCSVRENDSDLAQAFVTSKVSSYLNEPEAVEDDPIATDDMPETEFMAPLTNPHSRLHGAFYPVNTFRGWKHVNVRGRQASRSFSDLGVFHSMLWTTPAKPRAVLPSRNKPGEAPIEQLPVEILDSIIELLALDIPPNGVTRRNVDLMSLLLTSRTMHAATLNTLYKHITIPHSRIFKKFLDHIRSNPALGTIVRRLDFSHFNPATIFMTGSEREAAQNLTARTLIEALSLTPNLLEFLAQEYLDDDLNEEVLRKLFLGLPRIQALDFCGCSSPRFRAAFEGLLTSTSGQWPATLPLTRLSLHKCITLPSSVFETLLPRLPNLTHLDVAATRITDAALESIPHRARLTHLNLAKCKLLSPEAVIKFVTSHPAARELVFLSLGTDLRSHQLLEPCHVTELLKGLPKTLKSLSLKGSKMESSIHVPLLRPWARRLEELSLGRCLSTKDLQQIFGAKDADGDVQMGGSSPRHGGDDDDAEGELQLRYLDISDLAASELDLGALVGRRSAVVTAASLPLEVIEVGEGVFQRLKSSARVLNMVGWTVTEFGSRYWMVRERAVAAEDGDEAACGGWRKNDGARAWKWGATYWGMRKVPVARAEVGGMYGSFMFSRKL